jgi:hypothetical protein
LNLFDNYKKKIHKNNQKNPGSKFKEKQVQGNKMSRIMKLLYCVKKDEK